MSDLDRRVSVAPMMDWTDRHCRYFLRGFSPHVLLYTEMVTAAALIHGDAQRLLRFDPTEHPVALQIGGSDAAQLALAARMGEDAGYREINLNCGCPSDRVHAGAFGACLMLRPAHVVSLVEALRAAVRIPVTVKLRIGVVDATSQPRPEHWRESVAQFDERDGEALELLVRGFVAAGADALIVHARKAVLGAFSPKDNREVPPLRYDVVESLRAIVPMPLILNGGLRTTREVLDALTKVDGTMLGREAYHRPQVLGELHDALVAQGVWPEGFRVPGVAAQVERMIAYAEAQLAAGESLSNITRHMLGLMSHSPGAREFRRVLSEGTRDRSAGVAPLKRALELAQAA